MDSAPQSKQPSIDHDSEKDSAIDTPSDSSTTYLNPTVDPLLWSKPRKWLTLSLITSQAIIASVGCSLLAVGARQVNEDLNVKSSSVSGLTVALYIIGLGLGPLYLAPLSETYGRRNVYIISFGIYTLLNVGCALVKSEIGLIFLRFFAGFVSSAGNTLGGGTIGDIFRPEERGAAQAIYNLGPTLGPTIGGLIGGYVSQNVGWRWLMWIIAISAGVTTILCIFFLSETYPPFLHARSLGRYSASPQISFRRAITRPLRMLFLLPVVTTMSLYVSVVYGIFYLHIITIPLLFGPTPVFGLFSYKWSGGNEGLAYLGVGIGSTISLIVCFSTLDRLYRALCGKSGIQKPEFRLPFMQFGMCIIPVGLLLYGWSAQLQTHFIVPLLGACIFAFGMLMTYVSFQAYIVDAFTEYSASALAATTVLRSIIGAVFCVVGQQLYESLGYGWGTSILAFISCGALPIPFLLWRFGERLRKTKFAA